MNTSRETIQRRTFLRQFALASAAIGAASACPFSVADTPPPYQFPRSTPEEQGVSSAGLLEFLDAAERLEFELHSFMLARHGQVVAEGWWKPNSPGANHALHSLSKSSTSTAVGFAISEAKLSVEDRVLKFFPDDLPGKVSSNMKAMEVRHLLTMSAGHFQDSQPALLKDQNWAKAFLAQPFDYKPGTYFCYDSGASYMLSAIVQHVTGQRLLDYLGPRLFEPLGIQGMTWETCPRGINAGGWGPSMQTEGVLKLGQFYLQQGLWSGRQLLPTAWIGEATSFKIQQPVVSGQSLEEVKSRSDNHQGYCYQFWRCRHNAYCGDGAHGQLMIVMPDQQAVVAITAFSDVQGELDLVWDHILPAIRPAALPPDAPAREKLAARLSSLVVPPS